mgnify:CR=1 FL=1
MIQSRRQVWQYAMFQIPLMAVIACLIIAILSWFLHLGKPPVSTAIVLDLSNSTSGIIREQEIQAVKSYLAENQTLKRPHQVQVFGFASQVQPLNSGFSTNTQEIESQITQYLETVNTSQVLGGVESNVDLAIQEGVKALSQQQKHCRELLLVTDGLADVSMVAIESAIRERVKINSVIVGDQDANPMREASVLTQGLYFMENVSNLQNLFANTLFARFNSNIKWVIFWLGAAFIFLMWMLILPLDRWVFQGIMGLDITLGGQLALSHALFWTVLTLSVIWKVWGLPFGNNC